MASVQNALIASTAWSGPLGFKVRADVCNSCHATEFTKPVSLLPFTAAFRQLVSGEFKFDNRNFNSPRVGTTYVVPSNKVKDLALGVDYIPQAIMFDEWSNTIDEACKAQVAGPVYKDA